MKKLNTKLYNHIENKIENQVQFEKNKKSLSKQCQIVYDAFLRGEKLTTSTALIKYGVGDLRRRVKDLKDIWNIPVEDQYLEGRFKEYFLKI